MRVNFALLGGIVCAIAAPVLLFPVLHDHARRDRLYGGGGVATRGRVTRAQPVFYKTNRNGSGLAALIVRVEYVDAGGRTREASASFRESTVREARLGERIRVGGVLGVRYLADDPGYAVVERSDADFRPDLAAGLAAPVCLALAGVLLLGGSALARSRQRPGAQQATAAHEPSDAPPTDAPRRNRQQTRAAVAAATRARRNSRAGQRRRRK